MERRSLLVFRDCGLAGLDDRVLLDVSRFLHDFFVHRFFVVRRCKAYRSQ